MDYIRVIAKEIGKHIKLDDSAIEELINYVDGKYVLPCYKLANSYRKSPNFIATELSSKLNVSGVSTISAIGGNIVFYLNKKEFVDCIVDDILDRVESISELSLVKKRDTTVVVSISNIIDPLNITNIRLLMKGTSIYKLYRKAGVNVNGVIYIKNFKAQLQSVVKANKGVISDEDIKQNIIDDFKKVLKVLNLGFNFTIKVDGDFINLRKDVMKELYNNQLVKMNAVMLKEFNMAPLLLDKKENVFLEITLNNKSSDFIFVGEDDERYYFNQEKNIYDLINRQKSSNWTFVGIQNAIITKSLMEDLDADDKEFMLAKLLNDFESTMSFALINIDEDVMEEYLTKLLYYLRVILKEEEGKNTDLILATYYIVKSVLELV